MRTEAALPASRPSASNRVLWCGCVVLCLAILLAPALWNGFPLLQYDTGGYLARWFEGYLVPSRPAAYGLLLAAAARFQFWPVLLLQAACTIWIIYVLLREFGLGGRPRVLLGVVAVMSLTTTLSFLTSILLTDIFAGAAVIALHLLVFFGQRLARWERIGIVVLAAFGVATHSATLGADRGAHRARANRRLVARRYCSARGGPARGRGVDARRPDELDGKLDRLGTLCLSTRRLRHPVRSHAAGRHRVPLSRRSLSGSQAEALSVPA